MTPCSVTLKDKSARMVRYSFNFNILLTPYGVCCALFSAIQPHQNPNISSPPKGMGGSVRENEPASATESKKCYTGRNNLELLERNSGGRRAPFYAGAEEHMAKVSCVGSAASSAHSASSRRGSKSVWCFHKPRVRRYMA